MKNPNNIVEVFLQPGGFYFGGAPTRIRTLLGSCVSMTLWHPALRIGGMCHFMLPSRRHKTGEIDGKYADEALELFLLAAARYKTRSTDFHVKLFGGSNMFPEHYKKKGGTNIAAMNVAAAQMLTARHNLNITAHDLGRTGHRNIILDIESGHVWVRHQKLKRC
jgi:chemotaxis protein CheD